MNRLPRAAIMCSLRDKLEAQGSWCGETHLQKATFFLKEAAGVPLPYEFVLYKHGPFSFDLRTELAELRADGLLALEPQSFPYGPRLVATHLAERLQLRFPKTLKQFEEQLDVVARFIGGQGVTALERLATALLLIKRHSDTPDDHFLAEQLRLVKPHVTEQAALEALHEVRDFLAPLNVKK